MAFSQIAAVSAPRCEALLSADNMAKDRLSVITILRQAAPILGLKAPLIATMDALLSCLPASRNHNTVFASNATLSFRRDGLCERSLRRHFAQLQDMGLLLRHDSPNGKRFSRYNPQTEMALRFGFDLSPLFARLPELAALALQAQQDREAKHYTKLQILDLLAQHPEDADCQAIKTQLRRKLTLIQLQDILTNLQAKANAVVKEMSGTDGKNVRHHHKTEKDIIDNRSAALEPNPAQDTSNAASDPASDPVDLVLTHCTEAKEFAVTPIRTMADIIRHAQNLAPMLGIAQSSYRKAEELRGAAHAAITLWLVMQKQKKIANLAAYFQSLLLGRHAAKFDPLHQLQRLRGQVVRGQQV